VTPGTVSHYYWKGSLESSTECGLTIKSRRDLLPRLKEEIRQVHTYEVPEILALPVVDGSPEYLDWMDRELGLEP
jgi:periplasmic divalent cation tolerance protein